MKIDWANIGDREFEELCLHILTVSDFSNISWFGKYGSDKGRDLLATKIEEPIPFTKHEKKWVVQCKRYTKKHMEINELNTLLCKCKEHKPDSILIMITNTLKPGVKDWLENVKQDFPFNIYVWEQNDLSRIIRENKVHFINQFPQLFAVGEPINMYPINMGEFYFGIDELEEVELRAFNCLDVEEAKEKIKEFIAYIKANEINID